MVGTKRNVLTPFCSFKLWFRCPLSDVEAFKSGDLPMSAPSKEYANTIIRGLTEGKQLSEDEAIAYIQEASTKPL